MSIEGRDWAWKQQVSPPAKLVLLALGDYHNPEWGYANPSMATLGGKCSMTARQARRHVAALRDLGLIEVDQHYSARGDYASNRYFLNFEMHAFLRGVRTSTSVPTDIEGGGTDAGDRTYGHPRQGVRAPVSANPLFEPIGEPVEEPVGEPVFSRPLAGRAPSETRVPLREIRARDADDTTAEPVSVGTVLLAPPAQPVLSLGDNPLFDAEGRRIPTAAELQTAEEKKAQALAIAHQYMAARQQPQPSA